MTSTAKRRPSGRVRFSMCAVLLLAPVCGTSSATAQVPAATVSFATPAPQGQMVAGRVVSNADGHPIPNATITLAPQTPNGRRPVPRGAGQTGPNGQTTQTDAEGRYRLSAPTAGRFTLRATAPGYLGSLYLQHENFSSAIVTGTAVRTDNLSFALVPEASLHGRILDDTGEPVRATVLLYRDASDTVPSGAALEGTPRIRPAGAMQSDEDGQYEFANLQPGKYYVAVTAMPWYAVHPPTEQNEERLPYRTSIDPALDVAYPTTFYPHATTEQAALPIELKPGGRGSGNLLLQAEPALTLTVQLPPSDGSPQGGMQVFPSLSAKIFGRDQGVATQISGRVGDTVIISGLAPGQYAMRASGRRGGSGAETAVNLSSGSMTVPLPPAAVAGSSSVSVALRSASGTALEDNATVLLRGVGNPRFGNDTPAGKMEKGTAHFDDVPAGAYRVIVQQDGESWNVSRLSVGGKVIASKVLRVEGAPVQAEVTASRYAPEVDGEVHSADGAVHAGSLVVLVPAGADTGEDLFRADQSDLDGEFQFHNVLPGNYLLVALDNNWKLNWRDASALMPYLPRALPVTVPSSGASVVTLREPAIAQQK